MGAAENLLNEEIVIVPGLKVKPGAANVGYMLHWRLRGYVDQNLLKAALSKVIEEEHFPSEARTDKYLQRAMATLKDRSSDLVRKAGRGKRAISLVTEDYTAIDLEEQARKKETAEAQGIDYEVSEGYTVRLTAKIISHKDGSEELVCTPNNHPLVKTLKEEFRTQQGLYSASIDLSQWLSTKIMPLVNATRFREQGGVYVIPPGEDAARFEKIAEAIHSVTQFDHRNFPVNGVKLYMTPVVAGEHLQEAIIDSLSEELTELVEDINEKVDEKKLKAKGWRACRKDVMQALTKFQKFENFLSVDLSEFRDKCEQLENNIGMMEAQLEYDRKQKAKEKAAQRAKALGK